MILKEEINEDSLDISCIVLAGGKSTRLGRDKIVEIIGNKSLLQRVISRLSFFDRDIIIVTAKEQSFPLSIDYPKLRIAADIYSGKGSLGGIYTGLTVSDSFHNLVVAGDMPFLNRALLRHMIQLSCNFDVVIPRMNNLLEPLHAVYSKACLTHIKNLFRRGRLKTLEILPFAKVRYVDIEEIDRFDPMHLSFFNINTETDLEEARTLAVQE